jgi:hypothetical protein
MSNYENKCIGAQLMGEEKVNMQDLARKVDELVNVLRVIAGDLAEVTKSLKAVSGPVAVPAGSVLSSAGAKRSIKDVKQAFSPELAGMLLFEERDHFIVVKPRRFLGSDNFARIAAIVRDLNGEYVSAGKNSHFNIPK